MWKAVGVKESYVSFATRVNAVSRGTSSIFQYRYGDPSGRSRNFATRSCWPYLSGASSAASGSSNARSLEATSCFVHVSRRGSELSRAVAIMRRAGSRRLVWRMPIAVKAMRASRVTLGCLCVERMRLYVGSSGFPIRAAAQAPRSATASTC